MNNFKYCERCKHLQRILDNRDVSNIVMIYKCEANGKDIFDIHEEADCSFEISDEFEYKPYIEEESESDHALKMTTDEAAERIERCLLSEGFCGGELVFKQFGVFTKEDCEAFDYAVRSLKHLAYLKQDGLSGNWIPVSTEKPKKDLYVLAKGRGGRCYIAYWSGGDWYERDGDWIMDDICLWMPIPKV